MTTYQEVVLNARKKFLMLNKIQEKELLNLYKELANQLQNDIAACRTSSQDAYLRKLNEIVQVNINQLNSQLSAMVKANIETSSQIASTVESFYYQQITDDSVLSTMFNNVVLNTSRKTVTKLIQGAYYEDGKTLDQRLWNITKSNAKDIDTLIKVNVLKGANARELALQVNKYVNPTKVLEAHALEDGMSEKIAYQSQRLARTSITHAFAETTIENAKNNPFNKGIKWNLSASHSFRMHGKTDICDDYSGRVFKPNEIPLQHPNCLCYFTEENIDIDQAIKELKEWNNGGTNLKLDKWYKENNKNNELNQSISDIIKGRKKAFKPAKNIKKAEGFVKDILGIRNVSYKGCDLATANEWNKGLYESFNKFPELKNNFGFVGECHERNTNLKPIAKQYYLDRLIKDNPKVAENNIELLKKYADKQVRTLMKNVSVSKNTFAQSWSPRTEVFKGFRGVTVNRDWGKNSEIFKSALSDNVKSKFHPEYCDTIKSVLDHEIGHQLDDLLKISEIEEIQDLFDSKTNLQLTEEISQYSWNNDNSNKYGEFIAEGWAEYCNNPTPRLIAKRIGETIERVYKEWKKKNL
ncbi:hypothetical protein UT300005_05600 [Clostridium sp. CTA-5]